MKRRLAAFLLAMLLTSAYASCAQDFTGSNVGGTTSTPLQMLRVCADPDNLPYSREDHSGFENHIAQLIADDLHVPLAYTWLPERRGFLRNTLNAGLCDVVIGVPEGFTGTRNTKPYYRSGFVLVERRDSSAPLVSFDDSRITTLRIGVQLIGNDLAASPPAYALARSGAIQNVSGYTLYGEGPPAQRMIAAVAKGELDVAVVWGAQAGYFAKSAAVPLCIAWARPPAALANMPFEYAISLGVRTGDGAMQTRLNDVLSRRQHDIDRILRTFAVPRTDLVQETVPLCAP